MKTSNWRDLYRLAWDLIKSSTENHMNESTYTNLNIKSNYNGKLTFFAQFISFHFRIFSGKRVKSTKEQRAMSVDVLLRAAIDVCAFFSRVLHIAPLINKPVCIWSNWFLASNNQENKRTIKNTFETGNKQSHDHK